MPHPRNLCLTQVTKIFSYIYPARFMVEVLHLGLRPILSQFLYTVQVMDQSSIYEV